MSPKSRQLVLSLACAALLAAPFAEAARIGKGRSSGMQRSAKPAPTYQQAAPTPNYPAQAAPQPRSGPGVGTAIAAGAAGAAAGYMLGNAMSDKGTAQANTAAEKQAAGEPATPQQSGGMGIGTILLLAVGGFFLFRMLRRRREQAAMNAPLQTAPQARPMDPNAFRVNPTGSVPVPPIGGGYAPQAAPSLARLPDGTETPHFLRQAKATFMHLQSMNNPDNVEEVRKYMTPELFEQLKADITENGETADFPQLDCQLIDAESNSSGLVASVRFSGTVSESVNAPAVPFSETWHYIKSPATNDKWVVAGIQQ